MTSSSSSIYIVDKTDNKWKKNNGEFQSDLINIYCFNILLIKERKTYWYNRNKKKTELIKEYLEKKGIRLKLGDLIYPALDKEGKKSNYYNPLIYDGKDIIKLIKLEEIPTKFQYYAIEEALNKIILQEPYNLLINLNQKITINKLKIYLIFLINSKKNKKLYEDIQNNITIKKEQIENKTYISGIYSNIVINKELSLKISLSSFYSDEEFLGLINVSNDKILDEIKDRMDRSKNYLRFFRMRRFKLDNFLNEKRYKIDKMECHLYMDSYKDMDIVPNKNNELTYNNDLSLLIQNTQFESTTDNSDILKSYESCFKLFELPKEIIKNHIIPKLGLEDLGNVLKTCHYMYDIINTNDFWRIYLIEDQEIQIKILSEGGLKNYKEIYFSIKNERHCKIYEISVHDQDKINNIEFQKANDINSKLGDIIQYYIGWGYDKFREYIYDGKKYIDVSSKGNEGWSTENLEKFGIWEEPNYFPPDYWHNIKKRYYSEDKYNKFEGSEDIFKPKDNNYKVIFNHYKYKEELILNYKSSVLEQYGYTTFIDCRGKQRRILIKWPQENEKQDKIDYNNTSKDAILNYYFNEKHLKFKATIVDDDNNIKFSDFQSYLSFYGLQYDIIFEVRDN